MLAICVKYCHNGTHIMKLIEIYKEYQNLKTTDEKISFLEMLSYIPDYRKFNIDFDSLIRKLEQKEAA